MNKKILAAAVAAAVVAAPAAFAESTVYGIFHTSIDMVDMDAAVPAAEVDNWQVEGRASRLGFKGSEDLGNGLKAIYQYELGFNTAGDTNIGNGGWNNMRNTFVGLAGDWGTFVVGRHDTPAKMAFYAQGNEVLGDSVIDLNSGGTQPIGVFTERRVGNAIAYVSPNFSGFTFAGAIVPGEGVGVGAVNDGLADSYSVGAMWKGMGFKVGAGFESVAGGGGADDDDDMWQLGGSYTFGAFSVGASYEDRDGIGATDNEYTAWALTGKATFGNNAVSLVYTDSETETAAGATTSDTQGWGIAGEHNFSKRTKVYAAYAMGEDDTTNLDHDRFSLGMVHKF